MKRSRYRCHSKPRAFLSLPLPSTQGNQGYCRRVVDDFSKTPVYLRLLLPVNNNKSKVAFSCRVPVDQPGRQALKQLWDTELRLGFQKISLASERLVVHQLFHWDSAINQPRFPAPVPQCIDSRKTNFHAFLFDRQSGRDKLPNPIKLPLSDLFTKLHYRLQLSDRKSSAGRDLRRSRTSY